MIEINDALPQQVESESVAYVEDDEATSRKLPVSYLTCRAEMTYQDSGTG